MTARTVRETAETTARAEMTATTIPDGTAETAAQTEALQETGHAARTEMTDGTGMTAPARTGSRLKETAALLLWKKHRLLYREEKNRLRRNPSKIGKEAAEKRKAVL